MPVLRLQLNTPERMVYAGEAEEITAPTAMGEITILPRHMPLIAQLAQGVLRVMAQEKEKLFACAGGFIEVAPHGRVLILADNAEYAEEIDIARAEAARARAEALMKEKTFDETEYAAISAKLERELARLKVAHKHISKRGGSAPATVS